MDDIKTRIEKLLEFTNLSRSALSKKITHTDKKDGHAQAFYDVENAKDGISVELAERIISHYPRVNKKYLRTGEGDFLKDQTAEEMSIRKPKINDRYEPIPIYDIDIAAANSKDMDLYDDRPANVNDYYYIPEFSGCRAFNVYSDSMEPLISKGARIFAKKIDDWQLHLEYGQVYSIGMKGGRRYLKYIKKSSDKEYFLLESANPHYESFEIPKKDIRSIWIIDGWMNKHTQSTFFVLKLDQNGKMPKK